MADGIHWQDPREPMYNQPACGAPQYAPTATTREAVTCPVCIARTEAERLRELLDEANANIERMEEL